MYWYMALTALFYKVSCIIWFLYYKNMNMCFQEAVFTDVDIIEVMFLLSHYFSNELQCIVVAHSSCEIFCKGWYVILVSLIMWAEKQRDYKYWELGNHDLTNRWENILLIWLIDSFQADNEQFVFHDIA